MKRNKVTQVWLNVPDVRANKKDSSTFAAGSGFRSHVVNQFSGSQFHASTRSLLPLDFLANLPKCKPFRTGLLEHLFQYFAVVSNALTHSLMCEISRRWCGSFATLTGSETRGEMLIRNIWNGSFKIIVTFLREDGVCPVLLLSKKLNPALSSRVYMIFCPISHQVGIHRISDIFNDSLCRYL